MSSPQFLLRFGCSGVGELVPRRSSSFHASFSIKLSDKSFLRRISSISQRLELFFDLSDLLNNLRESNVYLSVFDGLAKFLEEKFAAPGVEPKVGRDEHPGDGMPGGDALKRSPLGLNSRDLKQSGCSGDSNVEGERATTDSMFFSMRITSHGNYFDNEVDAVKLIGSNTIYNQSQ
ncbi:hypothetical protein DY000_02054135 [Brassica cretica]|uniref:Uncharacterized protein n=1 Tax=Brassica cretica TaxID=69181 RepID=A0ABQ7A7D9_BRACR|nr:hypothetical protein DY000_02054135 [Brassica cretica]